VSFVAFMPTLNALLNATSGVLITFGYRAIRRKDRARHKTFMVSACITSLLFFASYLTYHAMVGTHIFPGHGLARSLYLTILATHTVLAAALVPLVIVTLRRALKGQFDRHRRLAHWTFPIWLYVSVTGVVVYVMLYHLYPA